MTAVPDYPSRNDSVTTLCPACGVAFVSVGRQLWCSNACRSAGYRRRRKVATPPVVLSVPAPHRSSTVYQCDSCDIRYLGEQRCESCGSFMRRLGYGGLCPCCNEAVAAIELVPEAKESRA